MINESLVQNHEMITSEYNNGVLDGYPNSLRKYSCFACWVVSVDYDVKLSSSVAGCALHFEIRARVVFNAGVNNGRA